MPEMQMPEMQMPEMQMPEIALSQTPAHVRHGANIGQPLTRREGRLKVTGAAKYAADQHLPGMLYAVLAVSSVATSWPATRALPLFGLYAPMRMRRSVVLPWPDCPMMPTTEPRGIVSETSRSSGRSRRSVR